MSKDSFSNVISKCRGCRVRGKEEDLLQDIGLCNCESWPGKSEMPWSRPSEGRLETLRQELTLTIYRENFFFLRETSILLLVLPKNWLHILLGSELTDTIKTMIGRRKGLLLAPSKENTEDISQSSVSLNCKIRGVLSEGYMRIHKGAWAEREFSIGLCKDWQSLSLTWLKSGGSISSSHPPPGWES